MATTHENPAFIDDHGHNRSNGIYRNYNRSINNQATSTTARNTDNEVKY